MASSKKKTESIDDLLTIEQTAAKMSVAPRTVRDWVYRRRVRFTKMARRVYIFKSSIEEILSQNVVEPLREFKKS